MSVKSWLLKQRLQNYGYDWKDFRKMSAKKTRLKRKIKSMDDRTVRIPLAKEGILGKGRRLTTGGGRVRYITGQSFNEELMNMMQLSASKGKKSFFE